MEDRLKELMQELGNAINGSLSDSDSIADAIGRRSGAATTCLDDAGVKSSASISAKVVRPRNRREAAVMAEVIANGASALGASGKTPNVASGNVTVSFKRAGLDDGATVQGKVTSARPNSPTPPPISSIPPQRSAGPLQPFACPSTPPAVALETEDRLKGFMQELETALNGPRCQTPPALATANSARSSVLAMMS